MLATAGGYVAQRNPVGTIFLLSPFVKKELIFKIVF